MGAIFDYRSKLQELMARLNYQLLAATDEARAIASMSNAWNVARKNLDIQIERATLTGDQCLIKVVPQKESAGK